MVFQHFNLVHRSSVLTNVLSGRLGYVNPAWSFLNRFPREDVARAHQQLERVGLSEKAGNRADELSGGQQQRVGIARALMQNPDMILADEPVASLDPVLAHGIMQYLEQINKQDGVTILCSLHFLDLVHRYADRVVALNQGRLVFDGLPKDIDDVRFSNGKLVPESFLYSEPQDTFATWIAGYPGVGVQDGFDEDPDSDGLVNGIENFLGTHPAQPSQGLGNIVRSGNALSFQHPQNPDPAEDLVANYRWSSDLDTWNNSGQTSNGTTVVFSASPNTPLPGITTVTATITGTSPSSLFVDLQVSAN